MRESYGSNAPGYDDEGNHVTPVADHCIPNPTRHPVEIAPVLDETTLRLTERLRTEGFGLREAEQLASSTRAVGATAIGLNLDRQHPAMPFRPDQQTSI